MNDFGDFNFKPVNPKSKKKRKKLKKIRDKAFQDIKKGSFIQKIIEDNREGKEIYKKIYDVLKDDRVKIHEMINLAPFYLDKIPELCINQNQSDHYSRHGHYGQIYEQFEEYIKSQFGIEQLYHHIYYPIKLENSDEYIFIKIEISIENSILSDNEKICARILKPFKSSIHNLVTANMENYFLQEFTLFQKIYYKFIENRSIYLKEEQDWDKLDKDFFESSMQDLLTCFHCAYNGNYSGAQWHLHQHIEKMLKKIIIMLYAKHNKENQLIYPKTHEIPDLINLIECHTTTKNLPKVDFPDIGYRYESISIDCFMGIFKTYITFLNAIEKEVKIFNCLSNKIIEPTAGCSLEKFNKT